MTPIVLVPGLLCSAEVFADQINALWPYGPVTVASTLTGETMAEIAANILAAAPLRFALAGISMGGYLCFEIVRQAPERVVKLALLDTSALPDTPEQSAQRRVLLELVRSGDFATVLRQVLPGLLHPAHQGDAALIETNVQMGLRVGLDGFARQQEAIIGRVDSRPTLAEIGVPTLVMVGDKDPLTPPERAREIADGIAGAKLVVVPECGHASTLEQPEAVSAALTEWIRA